MDTTLSSPLHLALLIPTATLDPMVHLMATLPLLNPIYVIVYVNQRLMLYQVIHLSHL